MGLEQNREPNADHLLELAKETARSGYPKDCRICQAPVLIRKVGKLWHVMDRSTGLQHHCPPVQSIDPNLGSVDVPKGPLCPSCQEQIVWQRRKGHKRPTCVDRSTGLPHICQKRRFKFHTKNRDIFTSHPD